MENTAPHGFWFFGSRVTIRLSKHAYTEGLTITEQHMPADFGPPLHVHHDEDETFYIIEGSFRFRYGDSIRQAQPGDCLNLPKGIPHGFRVLSPEGGRLLTITSGGFEDLILQASIPAPSATLPPQDPPTPAMQAHLAALCARNGIDLLGPPID